MLIRGSRRDSGYWPGAGRQPEPPERCAPGFCPFALEGRRSLSCYVREAGMLSPPGHDNRKDAIMPSTHLSLHYHLVFSTTERRAWIEPAWKDRLHAFLGGAVRTAGGVAESVGGTNDHVHLLIGLKATHRLADVLRDIKAASSGWVHQALGSLQRSAHSDRVRRQFI